MNISNQLKTALKRTLFQEGTIRTVFWGPCQGIRYRIFPGYGWSYLYGGWERPQVNLMRRLVGKGSTAYDLGANYGMHTLLLGRLVGETGRVFAFEPHPEIFASLKEQLSLNDLRMVNPVNQAVGKETGLAKFDVAHHRGAGHLSIDGTLSVPMVSLDDFVLGQNNRQPSFIKIDIEGAESQALRGGLQVIERYRPTMMIELHTPEQDRAVGAILKQAHYKAFRILDDSPVADMTSGWPDPDGMWGTVVCLPQAGKPCRS